MPKHIDNLDAQSVQIDETIIVTGKATLNDATESTTTTTGGLLVAGGAGIVKNVNVGGTMDIAGVVTTTDTTDSGSTSTGSVKISGGVGILKKMYVGGTVVTHDHLAISGESKTVNYENSCTVTQLTSLSQGVTCNGTAGRITLFSTMTSPLRTTLTVSNTSVKTGSIILVSVVSNRDMTANVHNITNNTSFDLVVSNFGSSTTQNAPVIHYIIFNAI